MQDVLISLADEAGTHLHVALTVCRLVKSGHPGTSNKTQAKKKLTKMSLLAT